MTAEDREEAVQELHWLSNSFARTECDADELARCAENVLRELSKAEGLNGELTSREEQCLRCLAEEAHEAERRMRVVGYIMDSLMCRIGRS